MGCTEEHAKFEILFLQVPADANVSKRRQISEKQT